MLLFKRNNILKIKIENRAEVLFFNSKWFNLVISF